MKRLESLKSSNIDSFEKSKIYSTLEMKGGKMIPCACVFTGGTVIKDMYSEEDECNEYQFNCIWQ